MNHEENAKRIVSLLNEDLASIDTDTVSALAKARHRALLAMDAQSGMSANNGRSGILRLFNGYFGNPRFTAMTLLVIAFSAFILTQQYTQDSVEQGDAFLLGSELPPEAYLDKGFDAWLERNSSY